MPELSKEYVNKIESFNFKIINHDENFYPLEGSKVKIQCNNCLNVKVITARSVYGKLRCRKCNSQSCTYTKNYIINIVKELNYKIIEIKWNEYALSKSELIISCNKCNNNRTVKYLPDLKRRSNCLYCLYNKTSKKEFENNINKIGLILVSEFKNLEKPVTVQCKNCGLIKYYKKSRNIFKKNTGCAKCNNKDRFNIDTVINKCSEENIFFLDEKYINAHEKHNFSCALGHKFISTVARIIYKKSNCPICYKCNINEKFLYRLLMKELPNVKIKPQQTINIPIYLNNELIKNKIIVDFMINDKICIEYNGEQHYKPVTFGSQSQEEAEISFKKQMIRDEWLRTYMSNNNIFLIEIDGRQVQGYKMNEYFYNILVPIIKEKLHFSV